MTEVSTSALKLERLRQNLEDMRTCEQIIKLKEALQAKHDEIEEKIKREGNSLESIENFEVRVAIPYMELTEETFKIISSYGYTVVIDEIGILLMLN